LFNPCKSKEESDEEDVEEVEEVVYKDSSHFLKVCTLARNINLLINNSSNINYLINLNYIIARIIASIIILDYTFSLQ